jgi:hypothetical protein
MMTILAPTGAGWLAGNEPPLSKQRGSGGCRLPVSHSFGFGAIVTVDR